MAALQQALVACPRPDTTSGALGFASRLFDYSLTLVGDKRKRASSQNRAMLRVEFIGFKKLVTTILLS